MMALLETRFQTGSKVLRLVHGVYLDSMIKISFRMMALLETRFQTGSKAFTCPIRLCSTLRQERLQLGSQFRQVIGVRRIINQIAIFTRINRQIKQLVGPTFSFKTEVFQKVTLDHG